MKKIQKEELTNCVGGGRVYCKWDNTRRVTICIVDFGWYEVIGIYDERGRRIV